MALNAAQHLAQYGVSVADARAFVMSNLGNLQNIFNVAHEYGVTNAMLAEIVGDGYTAADVKGYFSAHGINSAALDATTGGGGGGQQGTAFLADDMLEFSFLISLNTSSGVLSNASLRAAVVATTGQAAYDKVFDPSGYPGSGDGSFSGAELGFSHLGNLPATKDTMESLYYGTLIKVMKAIDMQEAMALGDFMAPYADAGVENMPDAAFGQFLNLLLETFKDPATPPLFDDGTLAMIVELSTESFVQLVGQEGGAAFFDGMLLAGAGF